VVLAFASAPLNCLGDLNVLGHGVFFHLGLNHNSVGIIKAFYSFAIVYSVGFHFDLKTVVPKGNEFGHFIGTIDDFQVVPAVNIADDIPFPLQEAGNLGG
jgi:hypothetical protein